MTGKEYSMTFRALPSDIPDAARIKSLLKCALRSYSMRCLRITETTEPKPEPTKTSKRKAKQ